MEASIKEGNIRSELLTSEQLADNQDFVRLLQCASRFGDELNMHANKDMVGGVVKPSSSN